MIPMGAISRVMASILLPVIILSACASPAATTVPVPTIPVAPTATLAPPTPSAVPPTATALPPTETAVPTTAPGLQGEGRLQVLVPQIQVDNGLLPWVDDFTTQTGCKVTLMDFTDYVQAGMQIQMGLVDVVVAGASSGQFISDQFVEKIDISKIPSWEQIDEGLRSASFNSVGDDFYGVPYLWIPRVLIYDTGVFPTPPDSWDVTFTEKTLPDGKSNSKRVLAPFEIYFIGDGALYFGTTYRDLGIEDPFQMTDPQLQAVIGYLVQQQALLQAYVDETTMADYFKTKGAVLIRGIPSQAKQLVDAGIPVDYVIPKEGSTALAFTQMLVKNAANPVCAYQWMEYSLDLKVQGETAAKFGANPSVPTACTGASEVSSAVDCDKNGANKLDTFFFVQTPAKDCRKGRTNCVEFQRWIDEYNKLVNP